MGTGNTVSKYLLVKVGGGGGGGGGGARVGVAGSKGFRRKSGNDLCGFRRGDQRQKDGVAVLTQENKDQD